MIKPGDITDEAAIACKYAVLDSVSRCENPKGNLKGELAAILNAAIEAGLVSPRLPATDDPRVLRRAFENLFADVSASKEFIDECIEQARKELETEGGVA